jgi:hypothetical protein
VMSAMTKSIKDKKFATKVKAILAELNFSLLCYTLISTYRYLQAVA